MKFTLPLVAVPVFALTLVAAVGCQDKKEATASAAPMSLQPTPAQQPEFAPIPQAAAYTPAPAAAPADPVAAAPIDTTTPTAMSNNPSPSAPATPFATAGGKYTVKAGDTLYRIAVSHYGDGKQWKKIADANPGVTPSHLKVGQSINLP